MYHLLIRYFYNFIPVHYKFIWADSSSPKVSYLGRELKEVQGGLRKGPPHFISCEVSLNSQSLLMFEGILGTSEACCHDRGMNWHCFITSSTIQFCFHPAQWDFALQDKTAHYQTKRSVYYMENLPLHQSPLGQCWQSGNWQNGNWQSANTIYLDGK